MHSHFDVVVISSLDSAKRSSFSGYAFIGPDFIFGDAGFSEYRGGSDASTVLHEDGCYFLAERQGEDLVASTDFKGLCKIFLYQHGDQWALSNSFAALVEFARSQRWPVTANAHVLATWSLHQAFWQQQASFDTAAREISLVPRGDVVRVRADGTLACERPPQSPLHTGVEGYRDALREFLNVWMSRLETLRRVEGWTVISELTGGLDSRVVFALGLGLRRHAGVELSGSYSAFSLVGNQGDFDIASRLAAEFDVDFNCETAPGPLGEATVSSFGRWVDCALGNYAPVYRPHPRSANGVVRVGGHGGEAHRRYWKFRSPFVPLMAAARSFSSPGEFLRAAKAMASATRVLKRNYHGVPQLIAHYQEFRDRMHGGFESQNTVRLQPLASRYLAAAVKAQSKAQLERGQALYDVIFQLAPELAEAPFDDVAKAPSEDHRREALAPLELSVTAGKIYGSFATSSTSEATDMWVQLREAYDVAMARRDPHLAPAAVVAQAEAAWDSIATQGRLHHAAQGAAIHRVILADLVRA